MVKRLALPEKDAPYGVSIIKQNSVWKPIQTIFNNLGHFYAVFRSIHHSMPKAFFEENRA